MQKGRKLGVGVATRPPALCICIMLTWNIEVHLVLLVLGDFWPQLHLHLKNEMKSEACGWGKEPKLPSKMSPWKALVLAVLQFRGELCKETLRFIFRAALGKKKARAKSPECLQLSVIGNSLSQRQPFCPWQLLIDFSSTDLNWKGGPFMRQKTRLWEGPVPLAAARRNVPSLWRRRYLWI